ncbi:MAG: methionyl-tRNA formyltransferase [Actinobacteria bacterium]|nr:methionyl-tRNA formyltransferase [Actinomycetota bacterium]
MKVAFFGTPAPAVAALRALVADPRIDVALVVTNPDRPRGRGYELAAPAVKTAALEAGLEVVQPDHATDVIPRLEALAPAACAVVAYGQILPTRLLDIPAHGFVNLHFSVLPAHRGAAPVPATILAGDRDAGVTCFVLDAGMDTGPILVTRTTRVGPSETAGQLTTRLAELGAPLLVDAIVGLVDQTLEPQPQDDARASYAPKISTADARIDWRAPADAVHRMVRAYNPVPGAHTRFRGDRLKIHRAQIVPGTGPAGGVIGLDARTGAPVVTCAAEALRLDEVQPGGKRAMPGAAFANGYDPLGETMS